MKILSLHRYPVKSLHGLGMPQAAADFWGFEGDRRWVVVDEQGLFLSQRKTPQMATIHVEENDAGIVLRQEGLSQAVPFPLDEAPLDVQVWKDGISARCAGEAAASWLSDRLGRPVRLAYMDRPEEARPRSYDGHVFPVSFADGFPLLICTQASLNDLNTRLTQPVPMARFRPNIVLDGTLPWDEDDWVTLRAGTLELRIVKPCSRCVMTTVDQESGLVPQKGEPLQTLTGFRRQPGGVMFGQNAIVVKTGSVAVGDRVEIIRR